MRATFKLLNSYFWKTVYGPIISMIFPVLILAILGHIMRIEYVLPGIIAMSIMFVGLLALPLAMMELKGSSLFKYIGSTTINPKKFSITAVCFYIFIALISTFVIIIATMIIFPDKVFVGHGYKTHPGHIFAGDSLFSGIFSVFGSISFLISIMLHIFFVIVVGLLIATFSKTPQQALTIGLIVVIPSMFLSGMVLSVDIIAQSTALQWISRFTPFRYTTGNLVISSTPISQIGFPYSKYEVRLIATDEELRKLLNDGKWTNLEPISSEGNPVNWTGTSNEKAWQNSLINGEYEDYKQILTKTSVDGFPDNNIFNWTDKWSVRRVPDVDKIKEFVSSYLKSNVKGGANLSNLNHLKQKIDNNDLKWVEVFMKKTITLFQISDRVLNIAVPITGSAVTLFLISKNFKWSIRT